MERKLSKLLVYTITWFILSGCSIEYINENNNTTKSESIPDSVMKNFKYIKIKNNKPYVELNSSLAEIYNDQNKTVLYDVSFTEYENSKVSTTGKANNIEYNNDTENAKLSGDLAFYSLKDEMKMYGDILYWNKEERTINSELNKSIKVIKDDGSSIEGYGFSANLKNSTFKFANKVTGVTK